MNSESVKELLYPKKVNNWMSDESEQQTRDMYKKTHGNYDPGEQKKRDYEWTLDTNSHRFGYSE